MAHRFVAFAFTICCATFALAAPPPEAEVQGLYEGTVTVGGKPRAFEARVVAVGKGAYKVLLRRTDTDGKVVKSELAGKGEGDAVGFSGKVEGNDWSGKSDDGVIAGSAGGGTFEMTRVVRASPTLGAKPPEGAVVLLDGEHFDEMTNKAAGASVDAKNWKVAEPGVVEVPKGGMTTRRSFAGGFKAHVEFKCPLKPDATGQARGNSGLFLPVGQEIQVLDSFGMTTYTGGGCGGLYKFKDPDAFDEFSLASAPPLQWQTYDVEYRVETKDGKPAGKPHVTVFHNGIKIHDDFELKQDARPGPLNFQDHGNAVQYRNVWIVEGK